MKKLPKIFPNLDLFIFIANAYCFRNWKCLFYEYIIFYFPQNELQFIHSSVFVSLFSTWLCSRDFHLAQIRNFESHVYHMNDKIERSDLEMEFFGSDDCVFPRSLALIDMLGLV